MVEWKAFRRAFLLKNRDASSPDHGDTTCGILSEAVDEEGGDEEEPVGITDQQAGT